jgi:hypothetical protein
MVLRKPDVGHISQTAITTSINTSNNYNFWDRLTGPHRRGPNIYPMTNNEIVNVPTVSESPNLSEIGPIAPAGAEDAKVVFSSKIPDNIVKYHFFPTEKF